MTGPEPRDGAEVSADDLRPGDHVDVDIGPVAHGGHCVARYLGRVVFVRLALPGERATVRITEVRRGSFCRGDVVSVLRADPERVDAPCAHFHPGGCGGCDFQHASGARQRALKAEVVGEQLRRLAGLDLTVRVEGLPGNGFGWRTRVRWALDQQGRIGPRGVRSHRVEGVSPSEPCLIAAPGLNELAETIDVPADVRRPSSGSRPLRPGVRTRGRSARPELPEVVLTAAGDGARLSTWPGRSGGQKASTVTEHAVGRAFEVAADGFWQVHPAAADALAGAVGQALQGLDLGGRSGWDLYGGVGLFAEVLAETVGDAGTVVSVEGDRTASALAAANMAHRPGVTTVCGSVEGAIEELPGPVDAIVLDPPRAGAGPGVCGRIAARAPAVIVYVSCDPAALGRDTAALMAAGYRLDTLRSFDCFPQTHHIECVARFRPA